MIELYTRVPQWLALDAGVLALPAPAQVALYRVAMAGGHVSCGATPETALDALCSGAGSSLATLVDLGAIQVSGGRIYLMAPDGLRSTIGATETARAGAPAGRTDDPTRHAPEALQKRLSGWWSKAGARTIDERVAWIDSPAGVGFLDRERLTREAVVEMTRATTGRGRGRPGSNQNSNCNSNSPADNSNQNSNCNSNSIPLSDSPSGRKNEETSGERTRAGIPTVERVGEAFDTLDLLSKMSVASDGLVSMTAGSSAEVSAFAGAVRGYLANGATLASVVAATAHLQHGHWTQRQRRTVLPVARLTAPGPGGRASVLSDLMAEATTCARCKGGEAPPKPAPTPVTRPPRLTREQMEAARDAAKERPCV